MELWEVFALFIGWRAQAFQDMRWLLEQMQGLDPSRIAWLLEKLQGLDFSQTTRTLDDALDALAEHIPEEDWCKVTEDMVTAGYHDHDGHRKPWTVYVRDAMPEVDLCARQQEIRLYKNVLIRDVMAPSASTLTRLAPSRINSACT